MKTEHAGTDRLALFAMLALFPGAFFYQVSVGMGLIPAFAGGYFGLACAALFVLLGGRYMLRTLKKMRVQVFDTAYFCFLFYFAGVAVINAIIREDNTYLVWHLTSVIQCAAVYLIFKGVANQSNSSKYFMWTAVMAMTACIFYFMEDGVFSIRAIYGKSSGISSYQGFALYYLMTSIIAISSTKNRALRILVYPVLAYALYVNGARSEFVAFLIFAVSFEVCKSNIKMFSVVSALILAMVVFVILYSGAIELPSNRVSQLLNLSEDNSSKVRVQIAEQGLSKIMESPLIGDYGNYEKGYYIHNILSAWLDLGLVGFIYLLALILIPLSMTGIQVTLKGKTDSEHAFIFSALLSCFVLLVFGKYFTYLMLPAVLGYYSSATFRLGMQTTCSRRSRSL